MALPIKRTSQLGQQQLKALVVGPPGSTKTLFGSTWPDVLYLSAEGGLLVLQELDLPYLEIEASEDLNKARLALEQDRAVREKLIGFDVKTVVVDTIDEIQRMLAKERMIEEHKEALAQADWGWLLDQMRSITRGFRNLDLNVVFTCHVKEEVDQDSGRRTVHPQIQGGYANEITAAFDEVLLLRANPRTEIEDGKAKRTTERFLQTYPDANHDWVKDRSGKLPPEFRLNYVDDYERLARLVFGKGSVEGPRNLRAAVATSSAELRAAQAQKGAEEAPEAPEEGKEPTPEPSAQEPGESEPKADAGAMQAQAMDEADQSKAKAKAAKEAEEETRAAVEPEGTEAEEPAQEPEAAAEPEAAPPKPARTPTKQSKPKASAKAKEPEPAPEPESGSDAETAEGPVCAECNKPYEQTKQLANLQKLFKKPLCPECAATCEICSEKVDDLQKVEFSGIRYRRRLCTTHFQEAGGKKKAS